MRINTLVLAFDFDCTAREDVENKSGLGSVCVFLSGFSRAKQLDILLAPLLMVLAFLTNGM